MTTVIPKPAGILTKGMKDFGVSTKMLVTKVLGPDFPRLEQSSPSLSFATDDAYLQFFYTTNSYFNLYE